MTEHNNNNMFTAYVGSSDAVVDKSTLSEEDAAGRNVSLGSSVEGFHLSSDENIDSDFRRRVKWRNPHHQGSQVEMHAPKSSPDVTHEVLSNGLNSQVVDAPSDAHNYLPIRGHDCTLVGGEDAFDVNEGRSEELDNGIPIDEPVTYYASAAFSTEITGLIDGGANGGLANPREMRLINYTCPPRYVNITGVGDLNIPKLKIGTFASKVQLQDGRFVLMIFHEYGELPNGKTIHSKIQLCDNQSKVYDDPEMLDGRQCIDTLEGYSIPIDFENGLAYIKMQYPSPEDMENLPCVVMTRDAPWNPSRYDKIKSNAVPDYYSNEVIQPVHPGFDNFGDSIDVKFGESNPIQDLMDAYYDHLPSFNHRVPSTGEMLPAPLDPIHCAFDLGYEPHFVSDLYSCYCLVGDVTTNYAATVESPTEYQDFRKFFLNVPASTVRSTFDATTRHYRFIPATNHFMTYKAPYPALNVFRRHEIVYTDTVFANVSAWGGVHAAQVFAGKMSRYISVHGCKTDADFPRCLEDEIRKRGAMDKLGSDRARAETSKKVHDIMRTLFIGDWTSEPHFHHQNFAERMIKELKKFTNWVLNYSDAPPESWYQAFEYVSFIMNRTSKKLSIGEHQSKLLPDKLLIFPCYYISLSGSQSS